MAGPYHPLDPLTANELKLCVQLLRDTGKISPSIRFVSISLIEPYKAKILANDVAPPFERSAKAVLLDRAKNETYEAVVKLAPEQKVESYLLVPGVQPVITLAEFAECEIAVRNSKEFIETLRKHYGKLLQRFVIYSLCIT